MTRGLATALLPRTLAGRVLLVMVIGVVVAHVASFAFFELERARALERERVHVGERQHLTGVPVLHDARNQSAPVECDLRVVHDAGF